jgi:hypothetical protein
MYAGMSVPAVIPPTARAKFSGNSTREYRARMRFELYPQLVICSNDASIEINVNDFEPRKQSQVT